MNNIGKLLFQVVYQNQSGGKLDINESELNLYTSRLDNGNLLLSNNINISFNDVYNWKTISFADAEENNINGNVYIEAIPFDSNIDNIILLQTQNKNYTLFNHISNLRFLSFNSVPTNQKIFKYLDIKNILDNIVEKFENINNVFLSWNPVPTSGSTLGDGGAALKDDLILEINELLLLTNYFTQQYSKVDDGENNILQ